MMALAKAAFSMFRGIIVATIFTLFLWGVALEVRRADPLLGFMPPQLLCPAGWFLAIAGGLLAAYCVVVFGIRGQGTPAPFDPPQIFVATGPYRYTRNPMYLGAVCILLGAGLIVRSSSIVLLAPTFWALAHIFVVFYEEPSLELRFGESYAQYRRQVSRWIPHARQRK
jgi:protein-S-isoprenylcysteine O-methyltransferase Ste14